MELTRFPGLRRHGSGDPGAPPERCVIDDRVLLLGLDELYRTAMLGQ